MPLRIDSRFWRCGLLAAACGGVCCAVRMATETSENPPISIQREPTIGILLRTCVVPIHRRQLRLLGVATDDNCGCLGSDPGPTPSVAILMYQRFAGSECRRRRSGACRGR